MSDDQNLPEPEEAAAAAGAADAAGAAASDVPGADPTEAMPMTAPVGAGAAAAAAPWYKRPLPLTLIGLAILGSIGLGWLLLSGDDGTVTSTRVTIQRLDDAGEPLRTTLSATVVGESRAPTGFEWLLPAGIPANGPATVTTTSDGRADFRWGPLEDLEDRESWQSSVTITEEIPPDAGVPETNQTCLFRRADDVETSVSLAVELTAPDADGEPWLATYTFPNQTFLMGDVVACELPSGVPPTTTTTSTTTTSTTSTTTTTTSTTTTTTTTTTVPDTTTTAPATTAPPAATTTAPADTTTTTTPPEAGDLLSVIDSRADLSTLRSLLETAPAIRDALADPNATITLFAPNNAAFDALLAGANPPDVSDPATVESLLLAHANTTAALASSDVLSADPPEIMVMEGAPQPVDAAASPPTIGGAGLIEVDVPGSNGVLHVLDAVMPIQSG